MPTQLDLTQDVLPLHSFHENPNQLIERLKTTRRPITLTVDGKPEAILQDPVEYQRLLDIAALADANEGIRQGLEQLHRGEGRPASEFFSEMCAKYGIPG